jgi:hypothetical protein
MKHRKLSICLTTSLLALVVGTPSFADDSAAAKPAAPDDSQAMAAMMEMAQPGEIHKKMAESAGTWTYKVKWWMRPDAPPMESSGTCAVKSVMDGRYLISEHTGKMSMPGPDLKMSDYTFLGTGTDGYDNAKKKYVSTWIDNMGTGIMTMEGTADPANHTITYTGEEQPLPDMKFQVRQVYKFVDKDHHTLEFFETHGGTESKTMEIAYTRSM